MRFQCTTMPAWESVKAMNAPALGKPSSVKPVLIWFSAGPCVFDFAVIEWMKHISSASSA